MEYESTTAKRAGCILICVCVYMCYHVVPVRLARGSDENTVIFHKA